MWYINNRQFLKDPFFVGRNTVYRTILTIQKSIRYIY